jgi:hypothetical protein
LTLVPDFSTGTVAVVGETKAATSAIWAACEIADATDLIFSPGQMPNEREHEIVVFG